MSWQDGDYPYAAGFFDGEGCIILGQPPKSSRSREPIGAVTLKVQVVNNVLAPLTWLEETFGGSISYRPIYAHTVKPHYRWLISGKAAAAFLHAILPWLKIKHTQAEAAILFAETLYNPWRHAKERGRPLTKEAIHLRKIAFRDFRQDIEKNGAGRQLKWRIA